MVKVSEYRSAARLVALEKSAQHAYGISSGPQIKRLPPLGFNPSIPMTRPTVNPGYMPTSGSYGHEISHGLPATGVSGGLSGSGAHSVRKLPSAGSRPSMPRPRPTVNPGYMPPPRGIPGQSPLRGAPTVLPVPGRKPVDYAVGRARA